ncbi:zinc ABC transporter substrate-binding protein [Maribellus comscasis]|uniref:Zinc ABC transporter substrate-binding protein n=1 Tax=Maribellus comscasis TaxID=2681766 RepID=A0A6I6JUI5_9BACT|nr:zinc ABC transporter substrate-binding protein [Maribellus comscasis]QGY43822.1 zinc ABC transporter substrate-binding protein [Maribellus comscasis]
MKKLILIFTTAVLLFSCSSSKKKSNEAEGKNVITVSILPEKTFVKRIAGDDFEVNVLIPPGASPAAYTLLPSQLKEIANSAIWFRMGYIGFEYSWKDKIEQANKNMKVVDLSEGLDLIADETEQHGDHVHMNGVDPHIWLSPALVKKMAERIADELTILNPEKGPEYKVNYLKFVKEIDQLNIKIKNSLKDYQGKKVIVFHPSLSYYARDYGLEQYSLESGGKEPTPQHLKEVVDLAKKENIKVIYIQSEFDREHARVFAEEIGGEIIQISPLDPAWSDNLMEITQILVDNF